MAHGAEHYVTESVQCGACAAREIAAESMQKNEHADTHGVFWAVAPREEVDVDV